MNYQYSYAVESEEGFIAMMIYYLVYALLVCGLGIVLYIFRSLGVYTIAKRRGLRHAWFAWVPVVDSYLLGCVSDQYRYVVKGQNKSKRKWLLGLNIVSAVLGVVMVGTFVGMIGNIIGSAMGGASEAVVYRNTMQSFVRIMGLNLPLTGVAIATAVLRYMALYDLYTSCDPGNNAMYLVLSIFFGFTEPFFIFFNRHKDEGMPPRREAPVYTPPAPEDPQAEDTEPWKRPETELE